MAGEEAPAVGIYLGATYSCVAMWWREKVQIIVNEQGNRTTPSYVAFTTHDRLIGEEALMEVAINPANTIFDIRKLIGRKFSEESVQSGRKLWPFKVIAGEADKPTIVVDYMNQEQHFFAEEIASMILFKLKETTSLFVGRPVRKAVITVPAYFNHSQRQATKDAATMAGIDVLQILDDPTAAALAYDLDNNTPKSILVFDLGGKTLDVSILELDGQGVLRVRATSRTHLGGQDFNNRMIVHLLGIFQEKYGVDVRNNYRCIRKLEHACEMAKRRLSTEAVTTIDIESFYNGMDFRYTFDRPRFEGLNIDLFDRCMGCVEQCLRDAHVEKNFVDEVILVGGSTRIPKVQEMLRSFFNGKELRTSIDPEEVVAYGASIQAAILNGDKKGREASGLVLYDFTPLSLGLGREGHAMSVVIPRDTRIPCTREHVFSTACDDQTVARFRVLEGERMMSDDNNLLGEIVMRGVRPAPAGEIKFTCTFTIDANGILTVTAINKDNKEKKGITITRDKLTLSTDEVVRMIGEAEMYELQDMERKAAMLRTV